MGVGVEGGLQQNSPAISTSSSTSSVGAASADAVGVVSFLPWASAAFFSSSSVRFFGPPLTVAL